MTDKSYQSEILGAIHESVSDLHDAGLIDRKTMREFDDSCLRPVAAMGPEDIKALREREMASQSVFALHLNVSKSLVSQWERGEKKPGGAALKLLNLVARKGLSILS